MDYHTKEAQEKHYSVHTSDIKQNDVVLGKGALWASHVGSIAFKAVIESRLELYIDTDNALSWKSAKTDLTLDVLGMIQSTGGRFLRKGPALLGADSNHWKVLNKSEARVKIRDAFRDCVKNIRNKRRPSALLDKIGVSKLFNKSSTYFEIVEHVARSSDIRDYVCSRNDLIEQRCQKRSAQVRKDQNMDLPISCSMTSSKPVVSVSHNRAAAFSDAQTAGAVAQWICPKSSATMMSRNAEKLSPLRHYDHAEETLSPTGQQLIATRYTVGGTPSLLTATKHFSDGFASNHVSFDASSPNAAAVQTLEMQKRAASNQTTGQNDFSPASLSASYSDLLTNTSGGRDNGWPTSCSLSVPNIPSIHTEQVVQATKIDIITGDFTNNNDTSTAKTPDETQRQLHLTSVFLDHTRAIRSNGDDDKHEAAEEEDDDYQSLPEEGTHDSPPLAFGDLHSEGPFSVLSNSSNDDSITSQTLEKTLALHYENDERMLDPEKIVFDAVHATPVDDDQGPTVAAAPLCNKELLSDNSESDGELSAKSSRRLLV